MGKLQEASVEEFISSVNRLSDICHSHNVLASQKRLYEAYWRLASDHQFDDMLDTEIQLTLETLSAIMAQNRLIDQEDQTMVEQIEDINDGLVGVLHELCLQMKPKDYVQNHVQLRVVGE